MLNSKFTLISPIALWREKTRLAKKLMLESEDYRDESKVLRTVALYWVLFLILGVGIILLADWIR